MKYISLFAITLITFLGTGCSSVKVIEGNVAPPKWVTDISLASNCDPTNYVYASGMSTYTLVLEEGINDARHDAIRKLAERAGVTADDIYRASRSDKYSSTETGMPNVPQIIQNSHKAIQTSNKVETKTTLTPQATHTTQIRLHDVDQALICYTVWQYGPSFWARSWYGDTALRFYDVYVLMRCPKTEFEAALKKERTNDGYEVAPAKP